MLNILLLISFFIFVSLAKIVIFKLGFLYAGFLALFLINSMGILPIVYLLVWGKEAGDEKLVKSVISKVKTVKKKK